MTMTNDEFNTFVESRFAGKTAAAAKELDIHRDTVDALRTGKTRKGADYPVPRYIELALKALTVEDHPRDPIIDEASDPKASIEFYNGKTWVSLDDSWFGPSKDSLKRWRSLVREWPSAAKIIGGAVMGYPVRIKGDRNSAEQIERNGGDLFVNRFPA